MYYSKFNNGQDKLSLCVLLICLCVKGAPEAHASDCDVQALGECQLKIKASMPFALASPQGKP